MNDPLQTPAPNSGPKGAQKTGLRPWLKAVLFVSLALNLAVAGLVIGAVLRFGSFDGPRPPRLDMVVGPYTHALSHEDKRAIGRALREEYRGSRPSQEQIRADFATVLQALRSTPYDGAKVETILKGQMKAGTERQELGQRLLLERLSRMTDAERAAFADRLQEGLERHRPLRQPGGHGHGDDHR